MSFPIVYFIFISLTSFAIFGTDKFLAKNNRPRISEGTLLTTTFFGGSVGSVLAMIIFKHKISKKSFVVKILLIIILQILSIYLIYNSNT